MRIACGKMSRQWGLTVDGISVDDGWEMEVLVPPHRHARKVIIEGWRTWDEIYLALVDLIGKMPYRRCSQCGEWDKKRKHVCAGG
jgi:hypothetical protein